MTCYHETGEEDHLRRVSRLTVERVEKALAKDPANASALATGAASARRGSEKIKGRRLDRSRAAARS